MFENAYGATASPDGRSVAFVRRTDDNRSNLCVYDLHAKQEVQIVSDTLNKNAPSWSPDGKRIAYNVIRGSGPTAVVDICIIEVSTRKTKQITRSGTFKSYSPVWAPRGDYIVYYLEKGDNRDQIYFTDANGSFHTNLTSDTSTHNYYPSWMDDTTILFTRSPNHIMTMNLNGSGLKEIEGIHSFSAQYNSASRRISYMTPRPDNKLMLYDCQKKTSDVLLNASQARDIFEENSF
jgi:Tol biopolymer transport system component